jgi:hypothetical protein
VKRNHLSAKDENLRTAAIEALEKARLMPAGAARNEALKEAGRLQSAVTAQRYVASKELKTPE